MNASFIRFENLIPNTKYAARFRSLINGTAISSKGMILVNETLDTINPNPVKEIQVFITKTKKKSLQANLTWTPSYGMINNNTIILNRILVLIITLVLC